MTIRIAMAALGAAALTLTACSSDGEPASSGLSGSLPGASSGRPQSGVVISVADGVLVGPDGRTLYINSGDTASRITCTGECAQEWPPVGGPATAGSSAVAATDLGVATRPDGSVQATYDGHPLYYFDEDEKAGDRKGEGIKDEGGTWHAAVADESGAPTTEAPTTTPPLLPSSGAESETESTY